MFKVHTFRHSDLMLFPDVKFFCGDIPERKHFPGAGGNYSYSTANLGPCN